MVSTLNLVVHYQASLDRTFGALADPTRRGILDRLARGDASVSALAEGSSMTLTGVKKHVRVLEEAGLVTTEKVGRVRRCRLGPKRLTEELAFLTRYQRILEERLDRLAAHLERAEGESG